MASETERRINTKVVLPLVLFLSLTGIGFMTPVLWSVNEVETIYEKLDVRPENFDPVLGDLSDSLQYKRIDSVLQSAYKKGRFSGQVLYAQDGKIIYNNSFGYNDFRTKDSITSSDRFQLASTSKPFTAVAVMMLQEDGKINIEDPAINYLPDFPFPNVTVKNLLQHRSGLPNYVHVADQYWDYRKPITNNDITPLLKAHKDKLDFTPGTCFRYCNTNYAYLALIIEKVTGKTFAEVLRERIFSRIGMENSFVYDCNAPVCSNVVKGYSYSSRRGFYERPADYLDGVVGDKGVYSTVEDMFLFDKALYNNNFLSKKSLDLAFSPAVPLDEKHKQDYGIGFRVKKECNGQEIVYHHGWWKGFRTYFIHDYENHRTLIWLNNRSDVTISPYMSFIMDFNSIQVEDTSKEGLEKVCGENYGDE